MIGNSRQKLEIEYRRQCIKDVWIEMGVFDVTQQMIADRLSEKFQISVDQSTISRDLKVIKQRIQEQTADDLKTEFFAAYMRLIAEARKGWGLSLEDAVTEITEAVETPGEVDKDGRQKSEQRLKALTKTVGQSGNPSFLDQEQKALKAMREMFGIDTQNEPGSSEDKPFYVAPIKEIVVNREPVDDTE